MKRNKKKFIDMASMHLNNEEVAILSIINKIEKIYTSWDQTRKQRSSTLFDQFVLD